MELPAEVPYEKVLGIYKMIYVWHIFFGNFIVFVGWKCRVVDEFHFVMFFKEFSNSLSVFYVSWHTYVKRFQTKIQDKGTLR